MSQKPTQLQRVYFLNGNDNVGREQYRLRVLGSINKAYPQSIVVRFDHADGDFSAYTQGMLTQSLFQDTRIFIIAHGDQLADKELKQLDKILKSPPDDAFIIIEISEEKKTTTGGALKKLQAEKRSKANPELFSLVDFQRPAEYKVSQWLTTQVSSLFGRSISKQDADFFIDLVGNDIDLLYSELQKIDLHLEPNEAINHDVIENIVGPSRQMTVFELASELGKKNFARALNIIDSLFSTTFSAPSMVTTLFRQFWAMLRIRKFAQTNPGVVKTYMKSKGFNNPSQNEAALAIGIAAGLLKQGDIRKVYPVIIASGIVEQAHKFTDDELSQIIRWLLEFDVGVKTGRVVPGQYEVQMLCFKISRVSSLLKCDIAA
ncbi:MAG TPA: DNA polymerase III subunit delta [Chitinispirillaceae bacterium]|nr:DNA polymerase III subunit delta [Chitinispirillaceae bacterium]